MSRPMRVVLPACCLLTMLLPPVRAQQVPTDPASTHIFPAGGQCGSVIHVRVGGECFPPYTRFSLEGTGVQAPGELIDRVTADYEPAPRRKPTEIPINYPREWQSSIEIAPNAPLGTAWWRLSCARGGTAARPFVIGDLPELCEAESNSLPERAERVALPITINGQIAGERDLDYYRFVAEEGQVVVVDLLARRLGSPLDPVVEVYDHEGRRQRVEQVRVGGDPVVALRVPKGGEYRLLVSNLGFHGGPHYVYRATLSTRPYVHFAFPSGGQQGATREVELFALSGTGTPHVLRELVSFPADRCGAFSWSAGEPAAAPVVLEAGDLPEIVENDANNSSVAAMPIEWPATINGRLLATDDEDWFRFTVQKSVPLAIECRTCPSGSIALPVVTVCDAAGVALAEASTALSLPRPCRLEWQPSAGGTYLLRVRDLQQGARGGPDFIYRLSLRQARPEFALAITADIAQVVQGAEVEIEVQIERRGAFAGPIAISAEGLPPGVRAAPLSVAASEAAAKLKLVAEADARPGNDPIQIVGRATGDSGELIRPALAKRLGSDSAPTDQVQLTVRHKPVFRLYCSEAYQYAHRGTIHPYLMEVERFDGFDGPISLESSDRQNRDLDGAQVLDTVLPAGATQLMLPVYLPETMHINVQAHSNVYAQGYVVFTDCWGQRQSWLAISEMRCMIRTLPTVVKLTALGGELTARPAGELACRFAIQRTTNFNGPLDLQLVPTALTDGFSAESVSIPRAATTAEMMVRVPATIAAGEARLLRFRARGQLRPDVPVITEAEISVEVAP